MIHVTYYLEVMSSWCYWAEPMWAELKNRYVGRAEFDWKIALMPAEAYPVSVNQCEWFYRRSGSIMRSSFMLNPGCSETDDTPAKAALPRLGPCVCMPRRRSVRRRCCTATADPGIFAQPARQVKVEEGR